MGILDAGVLDLEATIYKFDTDGVSDDGSAFASGFSDVANMSGTKEGRAYFVGANFLFPQMIGW